MFNRPEEMIMAILALLWLGFQYWLAAWATGATVFYTFMITGLVALWTLAAFFFWKKDLIYRYFPIFLGLLVACWTPWLNYLAAGAAVWYTGWMFKATLVIMPIVVGYAWLSKRNHQRRMRGEI